MRSEYPRPDFARNDWQTLNGEWDFWMDGEPAGPIQVPFVYACKQSGVNRREVCEWVAYERRFTPPAAWQGKQILLHFGAVDYECSVYVNGGLVCTHVGGHTPFTADITDVVTFGENTLRVEVFDPAGDETIARGKQFWMGTEGRFIWYTPTTGIWQPVWLEAVGKNRVESLRYTPDVDAGLVQVTWRLAQGTQLPAVLRWHITVHGKPVYHAEQTVATLEGQFSADVFGGKILHGSFHHAGLCWCPESPTLFEVKTTLLYGADAADEVESYFGMRKIHVENGRVYLNNKPYYQKLLLDQGYWPDSLMTAPDDEAFQNDIRQAKAMGFNGCRKHEKVEDPRFLYWADRLGFLVWGSMASTISFSTQGAARYAGEWQAAIARDYNHPSIVAWNTINESWGVPRVYEDAQQQAFAKMLYHMAHALDGTRLVVSNDGWETTNPTDIVALHSYSHGAADDAAQQALYAESLQSLEGLQQIVTHPLMAKGEVYGGQPVLLTEFGGISVAQGGEGGGWGYTAAEGGAALLAEYRRLIEAIAAAPLIQGYCYTQLADVQQEKNGLLDENHQPKVDAEKIREINELVGQKPILQGGT